MVVFNAHNIPKDGRYFGVKVEGVEHYYHSPEARAAAAKLEKQLTSAGRKKGTQVSLPTFDGTIMIPEEDAREILILLNQALRSGVMDILRR